MQTSNSVLWGILRPIANKKKAVHKMSSQRANPANQSGEMSCFLCRPDPTLIYCSDSVALGLCGLGPIVDGYSVLATKQHIDSAADIVQGDLQKFVEFAICVRRKLIRLFGNCLITEHGRLPVCEDVGGSSHPHCRATCRGVTGLQLLYRPLPQAMPESPGC